MKLAAHEGDGMPVEPDWDSIYSDESDISIAHEEWGLAVRAMRDAQTLTADNGHPVRRLVSWQTPHMRAAKHVAEPGAIRKAKQTKVGQHNPYWSVMTQAAKEIRALEKALRISPDGCDKAGKVQRGKKNPRAADSDPKPVAA